MGPTISLDRLPIELLVAIIALCSKEDAMNARLANQALAAASSPSVFREIHLASFAFSIRSLVKIAQSSYNRYVRTIYVHTDRFYILDRRGFEAMFARMHHIPEGDTSLVWEAYQRYLAGRVSHFQGPVLRQILRDAFATLPALEEVLVRPLDGRDPSPPITQADVWDELPVTAVRQMFLLMATAHEGPDESVVISVLDALGHRVTAEPSPSPVRRLYIHSLHDSPFLPPSRPTHGASSPRTAITTALSKLSSLTIKPLSDTTINRGAMPGDARSHRQTLIADLHSLLSECTDLQHLDIEYTQPPRPPNAAGGLASRAPLSPLFDARHSPANWPRLSSLRLATNVLDADLLAFMDAHATTLTDLSVERVAFNDAARMLDEIPRRLPRLRAVALRRLSTLNAAAYGNLHPPSIVPYVACYFPRGLGGDEEAMAWFLGGGRGVPPVWRLVDGLET